MYKFIIMVAVLSMCGQLVADEGKALFEANCIACHQPTASMVGPSIAEIAQIYRKTPNEIVSWAMSPGRKRKSSIEMPSMAHVGEENLRKIAEYVMVAAKKLPKPKKAKQKVFKEKLGKVQRVFMPDSGPASIAVKLPNGVSFCWDAGRCQLRYFWEGELDPGSHFVSNGNSLPKLSNPAFYSTNVSPFEGGLGKQDFLGYDLNDQGLPVFDYRMGDCIIKETLSAENETIYWSYRIEGPEGIVYQLPQISGYQVSASAGKVKDHQLILSPAEMKQFTIFLKKEGGD